LDVIGGVSTESGTHAMDYFTAEVHALDSSTKSTSLSHIHQVKCRLV